MKKVVSILLFAFVAMCFVFADEYVVSSYSYTDPDFGSEETVNIRYNDDADDGDFFMFVISDYFSTKVLMFTKEDLESMRITAQKALEWQKTAVDNKAEVVKEIPNSKLRMIMGEIMGSSTYVGITSVSFNFASIVDEDTGNVNTAMMIRSESTTDISNEFIDLDFPVQLIMDKDIQHFADAISEDTIQKAIDKHNNDAKIADDLFI